MKKALAWSLVATLLTVGAAKAQSHAHHAPATMGSWQLNTADLEASRKMFVALGGTAARVGDAEVVEFPNVTVFLHLEPGAPPATGGTVGTVIDHVGFAVKDIAASMARWAAAGVPVEPSDRRADQAWIMTPDGLRIEILEFTDQQHPIEHHHVHYNVPRNAIALAQDWYGELFGATPGMRGNFQASDIPGANLTWSGVASAHPGTRGTVLDGVGFEVDDLAAFCRRVEEAGLALDRPCELDPRLGVPRAALYDPWGTYLSITERR